MDWWKIMPSVMASPLAEAAEKLSIGADHGTIDFAIGDSKIFRTTGSFKNWQGLAHAVPGNILPDFPVINKSFNLSYSGNDL